MFYVGLLAQFTLLTAVCLSAEEFSRAGSWLTKYHNSLGGRKFFLFYIFRYLPLPVLLIHIFLPLFLHVLFFCCFSSRSSSRFFTISSSPAAPTYISIQLVNTFPSNSDLFDVCLRPEKERRPAISDWLQVTTVGLSTMETAVVSMQK
jgi:hypothetical protein